MLLVTEIFLCTHTRYSYRHVLYNWQRLTHHLVHRSYDGHIIPYWKSQRCKHDSNISQSSLQKVSQSVLPQQMILKSPPITIFPCIHTTHHTNIHSHTFTRFGQPHSDVQNITQSTLPACTHTHYTHIISLDLRHLRRYSR